MTVHNRSMWINCSFGLSLVIYVSFDWYSCCTFFHVFFFLSFFICMHFSSSQLSFVFDTYIFLFPFASLVSSSVFFFLSFFIQRNRLFVSVAHRLFIFFNDKYLFLNVFFFLLLFHTNRCITFRLFRNNYDKKCALELQNWWFCQCYIYFRCIFTLIHRWMIMRSKRHCISKDVCINFVSISRKFDENM